MGLQRQEQSHTYAVVQIQQHHECNFCEGPHAYRETLEDPFSAVSTPIVKIKPSLKNARRDLVLQNGLQVTEYIPDGKWNRKIPWYDIFIADQKDILYLRNLIAAGEKLSERARIWMSTIHAIKGGEEDNVILSMHQGERVQRGIKTSLDKQDEEHRVWYVGITRARNNLYKLKAKKKIKEYEL